FINGKPEPREYRRFRIRSGETPDDFRMMAEVLHRRFSRAARLREETGALSLAAVGADEAPEDETSAETDGAAPESPRETGRALPATAIGGGGKGPLSGGAGATEELGPTGISRGCPARAV